jgi:hypothetical protein
MTSSSLRRKYVSGMPPGGAAFLFGAGSDGRGNRFQVVDKRRRFRREGGEGRKFPRGEDRGGRRLAARGFADSPERAGTDERD